MGYSISTIRELVSAGAEVHVVHWDGKGKLTNYKHPEVEGVHFYPRSSMSVGAILSLKDKLLPDITVVSGWMDKGYLTVAKKMRKDGLIVVVCLDGQWRGTLKQRFANFLGFFAYFSKYFSHAWVAGVYQYEYARKLGFNRKNIVYDFYSGDLSAFKRSDEAYVSDQGNLIPPRFLYVGRLEEVKGLRLLLAAWLQLHPIKNNWELFLIGSGTLKTIFQNVPGVFIKEFMGSEKLIEEARNASCFILTSNFEPWGVVVHEFAAAGLPLLLSSSAGAANTFLIDGFNGFSFNEGNLDSLKKSMLKIMNMNEDDLRNMGKRSVELAHRITPQTSAYNLLSVINKS